MDKVGPCKNCGQRIILVNFTIGQMWMHQPEGYAFQDGMHEFCRITRAMPKTEVIKVFKKEVP